MEKNCSRLSAAFGPMRTGPLCINYEDIFMIMRETGNFGMMIYIKKKGGMNVDKTKGKKDSAFEQILEQLSDAQKKVIFDEQKRQYELAVVTARRKTTRRTLDNHDRKKLSVLLESIGYKKKVTLNSMRTLALQWILADVGRQQEFGMYVGRLQKDSASNEKKSCDTSAAGQTRQGGSSVS